MPARRRAVHPDRNATGSEYFWLTRRRSSGVKLVAIDAAGPGRHSVRAPYSVTFGDRQPVGGATSSRPFCLASGPNWVTETAAMSRTAARHTNTVVRP